MDHPSRPRILLVSDRIPGNMGRGDSQRLTLLFHALREFADVEMLLLANPAFHPNRSPWLKTDFNVIDCFPLPQRGEIGPWRLIRPLSPNWVDRAASAAGNPAAALRPVPAVAERVARIVRQGNYDVVVSRYLQVTAAAGLLDHRPLVVDLDDLETVAARSRAEVKGISPLRRLILRRKLATMEKAAPPLWGKWTHAWVVSDEDAEMVRGEITRRDGSPPAAGSITLLPNIPQWPTAEIAPPPGNGVLIAVASLSSKANYTGIDWFIHHVWPTVHAARPAAQFRVIGRGLPKQFEQPWKAAAGVKLVGFVEDLAAAYAACDFTVAPVLFGAGTKIKVLESGAYGRTCVLSEHALRGYGRHLRDGHEVMEAHTAEAFAAACISLLQSPQKCVDMGRAARAAVESAYTPGRFNTIVRNDVGGLTPSPSGRGDR